MNYQLSREWKWIATECVYLFLCAIKVRAVLMSMTYQSFKARRRIPRYSKLPPKQLISIRTSLLQYQLSQTTRTEQTWCWNPTFLIQVSDTPSVYRLLIVMAQLLSSKGQRRFPSSQHCDSSWASVRNSTGHKLYCYHIWRHWSSLWFTFSVPVRPYSRPESTRRWKHQVDFRASNS